MPLVVLLAIVLFGFSGCVSQPERISQTPSGRPEVTIATTDLGPIKAQILNKAVDLGYTIERDTDYSLVLIRPVTPSENLQAALSIGNGYSTNSRVVIYTFVRGPESIRVVVDNRLRAQLPGGQVNEAPAGLNDVYNIYQALLNGIKLSIESAAVRSQRAL